MPDEDKKPPGNDVMPGFTDPLDEGNRSRGPALWAALILIPIILAMGVTMARHEPEPETVPAVRPEAAVPEKPAAVIQGTGRGSGRRGPSQCPAGLWEGQEFTMDKKRQLTALGRAYRLLPPGAHYTMDHNPARLNFNLDEDNMVKRAWCG